MHSTQRYLPSMSWTIGDLQRGSYRLWVHCEASRDGMRCNHHAEADLKTLAARLGPDYSAMAADLTGRFKCARCGSRTSTITIHPPTVRDMRTGEMR